MKNSNDKLPDLNIYAAEEIIEPQLIPVFRFNNVEVNQETSFDQQIIYYNCNFSFLIDIGSRNKPNVQYEIEISKRDMDPENACRRCIQDLLNKNVHLSTKQINYNSDVSASVDYSKMSFDFHDCPQPWKELFESLFMHDNWNLQKQLER